MTDLAHITFGIILASNPCGKFSTKLVWETMDENQICKACIFKILLYSSVSAPIERKDKKIKQILDAD